MIIAILLVALAAALLVLASERRLNNRLQRQLSHEQRAYLEMRKLVEVWPGEAGRGEARRGEARHGLAMTKPSPDVRNTARARAYDEEKHT